jgi:uncharacterized membrane protein
MTKTRLEAFSDGVIAIIITIMVLELKIPHEDTWDALFKLWPVFISYVVSFTMLGIYWGNHHHLIHTIKDVSSGIMWANLHLLFWLSLIPFATGWMGENHFSKNTVAVYALASDLCGIAYYILLLIIKKSNQHNTVLLDVLQKQSRKGMLSCLLYTAAIPVAYIDPFISGIFVVAVAVIWFIPDKNIERSIKEN